MQRTRLALLAPRNELLQRRRHRRLLGAGAARSAPGRFLVNLKDSTPPAVPGCTVAVDELGQPTGALVADCKETPKETL